MQRFADLPAATRSTCLGCCGTLGAVKVRGEDTALAKQGFPFPVTRLGGGFDRRIFLQSFFATFSEKMRLHLENAGALCYNMGRNAIP